MKPHTIVFLVTFIILASFIAFALPPTVDLPPSVDLEEDDDPVVSWPLTFPKVHATVEKKLTFDLTLQVANVTIAPGKWLQTRTLDGTVPGPTIRIRPGQNIYAVVRNALVGNTDHVDNTLSAPNETNIHLHGLHIDGDWPSDSVIRVISPIGDEGKQSATYFAEVTETHMPGTHWLHPHRHGSATLQVGGGAATAFIVEDLIPKSGRRFGFRRRKWQKLKIADGVDGAPEVLLVFQPIYEMDAIIDEYKENSENDFGVTPNRVFQTNMEGNFVLVNGRVKPTVKVKQYQWTRFRIVNTAYDGLNFNFYIDGCEMALLAKDGVYIQDFPRKIRSAWPPPGGRTDVMVRCNNTGYTNMYAYNTTDMDVDAAKVYVRRGRKYKAKQLGPLKFSVSEYADYLLSTLDRDVDPKCSCDTTLVVDVPSNAPPRFTVNDHEYEASERVHTSVVGQLQERKLSSNVQGGHPYHQHIIPFQVNTIEDGGVTDLSETLLDAGSEYESFLKVGDWHDTLAFNGLLRFNPSKHSGKMILHCHKLDHEDKGMMSTEEILPEGGQCNCDWSHVDTQARDGQFFNVLKGLGIIAFLALNIYISYRYFTRRAGKDMVAIGKEVTVAGRDEGDERIVDNRPVKDAVTTDEERVRLIDDNTP